MNENEDTVKPNHTHRQNVVSSNVSRQQLPRSESNVATTLPVPFYPTTNPFAVHNSVFADTSHNTVPVDNNPNTIGSSGHVQYVPIQHLQGATKSAPNSFSIYATQTQNQNITPTVDLVDPPSERSRLAKHGNRGGRGRGGRHLGSRRGVTATSRKLSDDDLCVIIEYWKENYETWCKSNKKAFSKRAAEHLNRTYFVNHTTNKTSITPLQLERKFSYWVSRYKEIADQFMQSGFGLSENDPSTLRETAERKLKFFYELHSFLSGRSNITPAVILQTKRARDMNKLSFQEGYGKMRQDVQMVGLRGAASSGEEMHVDGESTESGAKQEQPTESRAAGKRKSCDAISQDNAKKKTRISGAHLIVHDDDGIPASTGSDGRRDNSRNDAAEGATQSAGENEGRTPSSYRLKMLKDIYNNQLGNKDNQQQYVAQNVSFMEIEAKFREKKITIMEKNVEMKIKESEFLIFEKKRLEREEKRLEEEEARKRREDRRKEEDHMRKKIDWRRKMLMDRAAFVRSQLKMYL